MGSDDGAANGEPHAETTGFRGIERVEDPLEHLRLNARAAISDGDTDHPVRSASRSPSGGEGPNQSVLRFHAYCRAPAVAVASASAITGHVKSERHPRGADASRKSPYAGASRIIERWLPNAIA